MASPRVSAPRARVLLGHSPRNRARGGPARTRTHPIPRRGHGAEDDAPGSAPAGHDSAAAGEREGEGDRRQVGGTGLQGEKDGAEQRRRPAEHRAEQPQPAQVRGLGTTRFLKHGAPPSQHCRELAIRRVRKAPVSGRKAVRTNVRRGASSRSRPPGPAPPAGPNRPSADKNINHHAPTAPPPAGAAGRQLPGRRRLRQTRRLRQPTVATKRGPPCPSETSTTP